MQSGSIACGRANAIVRSSAVIMVAAIVASCVATQPAAQRSQNPEQPVGEVRAATPRQPTQEAPTTEGPAVQGTPPTPPAKPIPKKFNLTGYPAGFRFGFNAGCDDARNGLTSASDRNRYNSDSLYRSGWRDGYTVCRGNNKK